MMSYGAFAEFYDGLTKNVNYSEKADYICEIFNKFGHCPGETLDLACGTGSLTAELKKRGIDVFGADMSMEMLTQAQQKAAEEELDIMFIRQKMQSLQLFGEIDTCVCTLDSLNHLQGEAELKKTIEKVSYYLRSGGLFVFDVNTPYKHREILGNNTYVYDTDEVFLVWQNEYREKDISVKITLDIFCPEGEKYFREREVFREFAYPREKIEQLLTNSSMEILAVYDDFTFNEPCEASQRLTFVSRKI